MKVAIYCRLSKDDEVRKKLSAKNESESIQNQKSILIQYAIDRGYPLYYPIRCVFLHLSLT